MVNCLTDALCTTFMLQLQLQMQKLPTVRHKAKGIAQTPLHIRRVPRAQS